MPPKTRPAIKRFENLYIPEPNSGCWIWIGCEAKTGYGDFNCKERYAHRFSYTHHLGPIRDGLWVLHRCDNRLCVNPDHLFLGTARDNNIDCLNKGRMNRNTGGIRTPLTSEQREVIRTRYAKGGVGGTSATALAVEMGVSPTIIRILGRRMGID